MRVGKQSGFTLIEVVVSLLLLAVIAMLGYQAVETVLSANQRSRGDLAEEIELHKTWQMIRNDLLHLRARVFADGLGGIEGAYEAGKYGVLVNFSRGGEPLLRDNPTGLSRIQYELSSDGELLRTSMPIFLSPRAYDVNSRVLLRGVSDVVFEQLSLDNYFIPNWPPLNQQAPLNQQSNLILLPKMIKVTISLEDGSSTWRIFPGVDSDV